MPLYIGGRGYECLWWGKCGNSGAYEGKGRVTGRERGKWKGQSRGSSRERERVEGVMVEEREREEK